jgi:hypothetical protein
MEEGPRWKWEFELCTKRKTTVMFTMAGHTGTNALGIVTITLFAHFSNKHRVLKDESTISPVFNSEARRKDVWGKHRYEFGVRWGEWLASRSGRLPSCKENREHVSYKDEWTPEPIWTWWGGEKYRPFPGVEALFQPILSHFTD